MIKMRFSRWLTFFTLAAAITLALPAKANTWPLPPAGSRLVGENKFHEIGRALCRERVLPPV